MMENQQKSETKVVEIDAVGGWVITHHTQTLTWDVRTRLDSYQEIVTAKQAALAKAQQELDDATATAAAVELEVAKLVVAPEVIP